MTVNTTRPATPDLAALIREIRAKVAELDALPPHPAPPPPAPSASPAKMSAPAPVPAHTEIPAEFRKPAAPSSRYPSLSPSGAPPAQWTPPAATREDARPMNSAIPQSEPHRAVRASARPSAAAAPRFAPGLLRRLIGVALAAAGLVGLAAYFGQPLQYAARVRISPENANQFERLRRSAWMLQDATVMTAALPNNSSSAAARAALAAGEVQATLTDGALLFSAGGSNANAAAGAATALGEAFRSHLQDSAAAASDPSLTAEQTRIEREIDALTRQVEAAAASAPAKVDYVAARARLVALSDELHTTRSDLARLRSQDAPRAEVPPEKLAATLEADVMLREDGLEVERYAEQYRTELLVALERLPEPLDGLGTALQSLTRALHEQIELKPPPPLRAVLEQTQADVTALEGRRAAIQTEWPRRRPEIEQIQAPSAAATLLEREADAWSALSGLASSVRELLQQTRQRLDDAARDGGTRESVVGSVVRGNLGPVEERLRLLTEASSGFDPARNFRIDAAERQIRGLMALRAERRQILQQNLQEQADRDAAAELTHQIRGLVQRCDELEQTRESEIGRFLDQMDRAQASAVAGSETQFARGRLAALQAERDSLDGRATADSSATGAMPLRVEPPRVELTQGRNRAMHALLAALVALMVTLAGGYVLLLGGRRGI